VPSYEHSRIHGVSNLHAARDGFRVVRTMLAEREISRPKARTLQVPPSASELGPATEPVPSRVAMSLISDDDISD
jgi:hypothetical protein